MGTPQRAPPTSLMSVASRITRYRCVHPGCSKRYSSTDGVRKHARRAHQSWLKSIDNLLERTRSNMFDVAGPGFSKPLTYSIVESGDSMEEGTARNSGAEEKVNESPRLRPTVKRLTSTGEVLLELAPDAAD